MSTAEPSFAPLGLAPRWWLALGGLFTAAHACCYTLGITFDSRPLIEYIHYLDPELLRTRLIESLWHLHIQPPLFNLFIGLVLKVTPEQTWLFHAVFLLCGFVLYVAVFLIQCRFKISKGRALLLSTLFLCSPSFMLFEHFLLYELPCAALLAVAALALFSVLAHGRRASLAAFFGAVFLLCGMRTTFHIGYYVLLWAAIVTLSRGRRRRVFVFGLVPFIALFGFYFKNYLLFGEFTVCTFSEKNLWIMTAGNLRWDDKVRLVEEGKLSRVSLVNRWAQLEAYAPEFLEVPERFRGIPALAAAHKTNNAVNYNHYGNIALCNAYGEDARYVLRRYPKTYAISVALSAYRYFAPATERPIAPENKAKMRWLILLYDYLCYGKWPFSLASENPLMARGGHPPYVFLLAGLPLLFLYGVYRIIRPGGLDHVQRCVLVFLCFHIFMIAALGCALDFTDAARYRFMTDGYSVTLAGLVLERLRGSPVRGMNPSA